MSEHPEVEQHFLTQLQSLGWDEIDQCQEIPSDLTQSLRQHFRQWLLLPEVFADAVRKINTTREVWRG